MLDVDRQWKVHSCFSACKPADGSSADNGFEVDERPVCGSEEEANDQIICLNPYQNECEVYSVPNQICLDEIMQVCIDWQLILIAILISNTAQVIFEASLAFSIELTFKPTYLERMQDPDLYNDEEEGQNNPDSKNEPHCNIVLAKCFGELLSILLYSIMIVLLIVGLLH